MPKKTSDSLDTWDIYLNQVVVATRLNINEPTKFSSFSLSYNHDQVLHINNILKPRTWYLGGELHKIDLKTIT